MAEAARTAFILGAPRSGTTFLTEVLATAPHTEAIAGRINPSTTASIAACVGDPDIRRALADGLRSSLEEHARWIRQSRSEAVAGLARRHLGAVEGIRALTGRRRLDTLVFKEPFLAMDPTFAFEAVPEARVVHLVRDGRDVAASLVRTYGVLSDEHLRSPAANEIVLGHRVGDRWVPWWVARDDGARFLDASQTARALWLWRFMVERGTALVAAGSPHRDATRQVHYEDLVSDPSRVGAAVAGHFGISLGRRARRRLTGAHVRSIGRGRDAGLDPAEVEEVAGPTLRALGYEVGSG